MGGGGGTSEPSSAQQDHHQSEQQEREQQQSEHQQTEQNETETVSPCPAFLEDYVGKGKYNICFAGTSGCGKSSLINEATGADIAQTGNAECTLTPWRYDLPVDDPAGHFQQFMSKLPELHKECMSKKLRSVNLWDLPGGGTRRHSSKSYVTDKGLAWFDFVVVFLGERVQELDHELIAALVEHNVKHFVVRSKLDEMLGPVLSKKKKDLQRSLRPQEKMQYAREEMENVRTKMVDEIRTTVPNFKGHCYLLVAMGCLDDENPNFKTVEDLHETQRAVDRLLLDIIKDRHGHDLRKYFDNSLYGQTSKVCWNWFSSNFASPIQEVPEGEPCETGTDTVQPDDSVSQITLVQNEPLVLTEESYAWIDESLSWVSASKGHESQDQGGETRCFVMESLFKVILDNEPKYYMYARDLEEGMQVMAYDGTCLQVVKIKPAMAKSIMHLRTSDAYLPVTPSHRVMVPSQNDDLPDRDVLASTLQVGDRVLFGNGHPQALTHAEEVCEATAVLAITFQPDKAVAVLPPPAVNDTILTKGAKKHKIRRGQRRNQAANTDTAISTDSELGMPMPMIYEWVHIE